MHQNIIMLASNYGSNELGHLYKNFIKFEGNSSVAKKVNQLTSQSTYSVAATQDDSYLRDQLKASLEREKCVAMELNVALAECSRLRDIIKKSSS